MPGVHACPPVLEEEPWDVDWDEEALAVDPLPLEASEACEDPPAPPVAMTSPSPLQPKVTVAKPKRRLPRIFMRLECGARPWIGSFDNQISRRAIV
jgi:hypothetical protein